MPPSLTLILRHRLERVCGEGRVTFFTCTHCVATPSKVSPTRFTSAVCGVCGVCVCVCVCVCDLISTATTSAHTSVCIGQHVIITVTRTVVTIFENENDCYTKIRDATTHRHVYTCMFHA